MKKAFIALMCTGTLFFAAAHPFHTNGAVILGDREAEVSIWGGTDFVENRTGDVGVGMYYGIGDRFQIGFENFWFDRHIGDDRFHGFVAPHVSMKMAIRPDFIAIKAASALDGSEFSGLIGYSFELKNAGTEFNFDLGFVSGGFESNAFAWAYSIVQPINNFFVGAEVFGEAAKGWDKDDKKPNWQIGLGHTFTRKREHIFSLGFGGSFVCKDDLFITAGVTKFFGSND